jgi:hypothetical protein
VAYYEYEKARRDESGYQLNRGNNGDNYRDYYLRNLGDAPSTPGAVSKKLKDKDKDIRSMYFLHEPIDTELRAIVKQVQLRRSFLELTQMLCDDRWWVPPRSATDTEEQELKAEKLRLEQEAEREQPTSLQLFAKVAPGAYMSPEAVREKATDRALRDLTYLVDAAERSMELVSFRLPSAAHNVPELEGMAELFELEQQQQQQPKSAEEHATTHLTSSLSSLSVSLSESPIKKKELSKQKVDSDVKEAKAKAKALSLKRNPLELLLEKDNKHGKLRPNSAPPPSAAHVALAKKQETLGGKRKAGRMTIMEGMVPTFHKPKRAEKTLEAEPETENKRVIVMRGEAKASVESLIRTAKLIVRVRSLLGGTVDDRAEVESTFTESFPLASLVRARIQGGESQETVALWTQSALGLKIDGTDVASIILNSDIKATKGSKGKKALTTKPLVHPFAIPEFRYYYQELNDFHRQIQAICANLFEKYNTFRTMIVSSEKITSTFTLKVQNMAKFSGGVRVTEMDCTQWLLLQPNSQLLAALPVGVLSRVGRPSSASVAFADMAPAMREVRRILRLTAKAYGSRWFCNTLPRARGARAGSSHCDLGLVLLLLCIQDAIDDYRRCKRAMKAILSIAGNGVEYLSNYQCAGSSEDIRAAFKTKEVEKTLVDALKFRIFNEPNVVSKPVHTVYPTEEDGAIGAIVAHYRRLLRFNTHIAQTAARAGIAGPIADDDTDKARYDAEVTAMILQTESGVAAGIYSLARQLGHGMWEHPLAVAAYVSSEYLSSLGGTKVETRMKIATAVARGDSSEAGKISLQMRQRANDFSTQPISTFRWLRSGVSLEFPLEPIRKPMTALPPLLGSLTCWMSANALDPLCAPSGSSALACLQRMATCGRACPIMRNELLLLTLVRCDSMDKGIQQAMWLTLTCLLTSFPPSDDFEGHMETWLLEEARYSEAAFCRAAAESCRRVMHQSIFLYGNNSKLPDTVDGVALQSMCEIAGQIDDLWAAQTSLFGEVAPLYSMDESFEEAKVPEAEKEKAQEAEKEKAEKVRQPKVLASIFDDDDDDEDDSDGKKNENATDSPLGAASGQQQGVGKSKLMNKYVKVKSNVATPLYGWGKK